LSFQEKLANLGITEGDAVSLALPNSFEFIVAFLASSWQRGIVAPLNPSYKQDEFEFYIEDLKSAIVLVPRGSFEKNVPAVRAARKFCAAIGECYWDSQKAQVELDIKDYGRLREKAAERLQNAQPDNVALVLHTSGTTGRPKAVCQTLA